MVNQIIFRDYNHIYQLVIIIIIIILHNFYNIWVGFGKKLYYIVTTSIFLKKVEVI